MTRLDNKNNKGTTQAAIKTVSLRSMGFDIDVAAPRRTSPNPQVVTTRDTYHLNRVIFAFLQIEPWSGAGRDRSERQAGHNAWAAAAKLRCIELNVDPIVVKDRPVTPEKMAQYARALGYPPSQIWLRGKEGVAKAEAIYHGQRLSGPVTIPYPAAADMNAEGTTPAAIIIQATTYSLADLSARSAATIAAFRPALRRYSRQISRWRTWQAVARLWGLITVVKLWGLIK